MIVRCIGSSPDAVNFWMGEEDAVTSSMYVSMLYSVYSGLCYTVCVQPTVNMCTCAFLKM